ncbi:MAG: cation-translocating P-type ATPase [Nitrospirota bacterium]|nr:cation-translocating P-type ATPase [Nitrospirota bacterium]
MNWHQKDIQVTLGDLGSSREGLSSDEARGRLEKYGRNELKEKQQRTVFMMILDQFRDFMILVLLAAAVISGVIGEVTDTIAIIVIVVLNAIIGFVQEFRAEKAMKALKKMAAPTATVIRDGMPLNIPGAEIVPGELVILEAGNIVPADIRLIEAVQLRVEESALTGESVPVEKHTDTIHDEILPVGDRKNMVFYGTAVSYGRGSGIVVATGMDTELGKIATMIQDAKEVKTPLQKRLATFGRRLAIIVLVICAIVFGFGLFRGEPALLMLLTAVSLAVAAIPEALPAVVTISLAIGAKKLTRQNSLIRKLPAVETLGSVTYICSDKTGTLTMNKMTVEEVFLDEGLLTADSSFSGEMPGAEEDPARHLFFMSLALNNDARKKSDGGYVGDPTEIALYTFAENRGFHKQELEMEFPRDAELPFDSERKCMTTIHKLNEASRVTGLTAGYKYISFTKGAIDVLLDLSGNMLTSEGFSPLDEEAIQKINSRMAGDGLRVLCTAMKLWDELPDELSPGTVEKGLTVLGLAGMMDPPREEAIEAIKLCNTAGIKTVMITGDHPLTARTIAMRLGILTDADDSTSIITGRELSELSLEEFEERVEHIRVYARVAPEQKLKIIKALQDKGHFAAMTGDGVNDAPALKSADIGVAMGITGTDVAKEASHMILLDDNFATIVKAVKEGRRIFDNIRKFIKYTMTSNAGEIWTIFLAPFLGLPIPLLPIHILWINLVTDGLPGLALTAEPAEKDIMNRPPRNPGESIFSHGLGIDIIWIGLLMGFASIFIQAWSIWTGHAHWQTMVFTVLCLSQMGNVLALRSERVSFFRQGLFTNKPLLGAVLLTFVLQMATIYVPFLNPVFKTEPLTFSELLFTLAVSSVVFFAVEARKMLMPRQYG